MSDRIQCRDCWLIHDANAACDWWPLWKTPEGKAELGRRKVAAYSKAAVGRDKRDFDEAWRWAQKAGAPYHAIAALRGGPRDSPALDGARKFSRDDQALFLVLLGPTGVGKTLAATLVVVDFAAKWPWNEMPTGSEMEPVRFVAAASLTRLSAFDAEEKRYVDSLRRCHLLVLEDAGDEGTELGKGLFVELLMARHAAKRRTVVTSNLVPEAFKHRYGQAVADRIRESGYAPNLFGQQSRRVPRLEIVKPSDGQEVGR